MPKTPQRDRRMRPFPMNNLLYAVHAAPPIGAPGQEMSKAPERYFYHSFPRRWREEKSDDHAIEILELIRDFGLLMTPEVATWQYTHVNGTPPRAQSMTQRRISFTELAPYQLVRHARDFGRFALEFNISVLKSLGAVPVFYIPHADAEIHASGLGETIVMHLIDSMRTSDRMSQLNAILKAVPQGRERQLVSIPTEHGLVPFELHVNEARETVRMLNHALAPADQQANFLEGALNFFYPDGDVSAELKYYRQREWRMGGNPAVRGDEMMVRPSNAMIDRLLALDEDFFGRNYPPQNVELSNVSDHGKASRRLVDECWVFRGLARKGVFQHVRRVIVPRHSVNRARQVLSALDNSLRVVALESVSGLRALPRRVWKVLTDAN
ncbi:MAG TPA: hypothetical protein VHX61_10895 [Rhizomicrobium sp.]|jgi:hypothetical protein|nr:hypothetical protein [Rhizomicrobium sp.]